MLPPSHPQAKLHTIKGNGSDNCFVCFLVLNILITFSFISSAFLSRWNNTFLSFTPGRNMENESGYVWFVVDLFGSEYPHHVFVCFSILHFEMKQCIPLPLPMLCCTTGGYMENESVYLLFFDVSCWFWVSSSRFRLIHHPSFRDEAMHPPSPPPCNCNPQKYEIQKFFVTHPVHF